MISSKTSDRDDKSTRGRLGAGNDKNGKPMQLMQRAINIEVEGH